MVKFDIVRKGYDIVQVDDYINKVQLKDSDSVQEKNLRISELTSENNVLKGMIKQLKEREDNVQNALLVAIEKAEDIKKFAEKKYNLELERIRLFKLKWTSYCSKVLKNLDISNTKGEVLGVLDSLESEFIENFKKGLPLNEMNEKTSAELQYEDEVKRLGNKVNASKEKDKKIDIEKLLEGEDLTDICKKLGIV